MFLVERILEAMYEIEIINPTDPIPDEGSRVLCTVPNDLKPLGTLMLQLESESGTADDQVLRSRKLAELLMVRSWLVAELGKVYGIYPSLDFGIAEGWVVWIPIPAHCFN